MSISDTPDNTPSITDTSDITQELNSEIVINIGDVVGVKLVSGLDIIGKVISIDEEESAIELDAPFIMTLMSTPRGPALNFMPLFLLSTSKGMSVYLYRVQYLAIYIPEQQALDQYLQMSSGIVIARGSVGKSTPTLETIK